MTGRCTLVLCGAPLSARSAHLATALLSAGWNVQAVATPAALAWIDGPTLREAVGHEPRTAFRDPSAPREGDRPDVVLAAPATFNTVNKLAAGIADTYAASTLAEALALGRPLVLAPIVSTRLWGHPAWNTNLQFLGRSGVTYVNVLDGGAELSPVESGSGDVVTGAFDPAWLVAAVERVHVRTAQDDRFGPATP